MLRKMSSNRVSYIFLLLQLCSICALTAAQYPPPVDGQKEIRTSYNPDIFVRYKSPTSAVCQTANPKQQQYAGYIHLPPMTLAPIQQDYPINTFFWFVEAREKPENAPLTIWLNGGPGSSSMLGMFCEVGPCHAVEANRESITSIPRDFGWDRSSNMLFIDQPNQVGFSYDTPTNGTLPLLDLNGGYLPNTVAPEEFVTYQDYNLTVSEFVHNFTDYYTRIALLNGTFPSGNVNFTANTTEIAARAIWHFLQAWLTDFPQYNPNSTGINLFAESYGGKYGPKVFAFFEEQNELRDQGKLSKKDTVELHLESLGVINGCVDMEIQTPYYPIYANSNPYNIQVIDDDERAVELDAFYGKGGCKDLIEQCRRLERGSDPQSFGDVEQVNTVCSAASACCTAIMDLWRNSTKSYYDVAATSEDPFPPYFFLEYLNNVTVQQAIGVPINYTESNSFVYNAFNDTGDIMRGGETGDFAYLLSKGVRVALLYGDRDYICNYMGGEAVSLSVNYSESAAFRAAGYENVHVNDTYIGGQVRQHGNFSFTRIYQAGHLVPAYQPETAYVLFDRIIRGVSLATGKDIQASSPNVYSSTGPANTTVALKAPPPHQPICFVRSAQTCTVTQLLMIAGGFGVTINGVLYNSSDEYTGPEAPTGNSSSGSYQNKTQGAGNDNNKNAATGRRVSWLVLVLVLGVVIYVL